MMTRKPLTAGLWALAALTVTLACVLSTVPVQAQDPIGGALATLAAATAQAEQVRAAQRATVAALSAEGTRQANIAQATARAMSAEATRQAQVLNVQATQAALDELNRQRAATATAEYQQAQATRQAQALTIAATATRQAIDAQEQAQLAQTYATRQARFTFGLLLVEIAGIVGACFVLWRIVKALVTWADRLRPASEPTLAGVIASATARPAARVVIDVDAEPAQAEPTEPRMPDVKMVDDPALTDAISRWFYESEAQ